MFAQDQMGAFPHILSVFSNKFRQNRQILRKNLLGFEYFPLNLDKVLSGNFHLV